MPFITEELWKKISNDDKSLISSSWNISLPALNKADLVENTKTIIEIITSVRSIRSELNIPSKKELLIQIYEKDSSKIDKIRNIDMLLNKLIKIEKIQRVVEFSNRSASFSVSNIDFALVIDESIDLSSEIKELKKRRLKLSLIFNYLRKN